MDIAVWIERLVRYGLRTGLLGSELDAVAARNALLDLFGVAEPADVPSEQLSEEDERGRETDVTDVLDAMLDFAAGTRLLPENTPAYRDLLDARIMGLLMPRPSEVVDTFWRIARENGVEAATDWLYKLSIDARYIRMDRIRRNLRWFVDTEYGDLEITINLSKPEKDPRDIAAERAAPPSSYPKCLLCLENVGYAGRIDHPARQNLRVIPVRLDGCRWYVQYSPYVYYNEHCIVFDERHVPMAITEATFRKLFDFLDLFPHYFIGSNADLPIVGGSILGHDHFQGGRHVFPMERAQVETFYAHPDHPEVEAGIVRWPMSVLRLRSPSRGALEVLAARVLACWRGYDDPEADVFAHTEEAGLRTAHNTLTPIARRREGGVYELDLVLRNNRTTPEHPEGLFHPHRDLHHIKKENIGLIEVMGLAVLPGRLADELSGIRDVLVGRAKAPDPRDADHPLARHAPWVAELTQRYGTALSEADADKLLRREVGLKFLRVLHDAAVFKRTEAGKVRFRIFCEKAGFRRVDRPSAT